MRSVVFAAAVLAGLLLSGCALSALSAENVMEPPQAYGDGAAIQAALEDALGPQITLRYPRSGEHRSAVVRADVDNDEHEEAIVFYRMATENTGSHMAVLDVDENEDWQIIGDYSCPAGEIDRIMFGDIDADRSLDIITGWSIHSDYGSLCVHSCVGGRLSVISIPSGQTGQSALSSYAEMTVCDFDGDSVDELLTVCLPENMESGEARLLKWHAPALTGGSGSIRTVSRIPLQPDTASYTGCTAGHFTWDLYGVVVDSLTTDGSYCSEILVWNSETGTLSSPMANVSAVDFSRTRSTVAEDINGDEYIEIPGDSLLPDCTAPGAEKLYLTDWHRYNGSECIRIFSAIMRSNYGYYFVLPEDWSGQVTAQPDNSSRSLHFYLADPDRPFSRELMNIRVFTTDEWSEGSSIWDEDISGYEELCTTDYYVYAVQISPLPSPLKVDYDTVFGCFVLML